jgi:hypothetical protein
VIKIFISYSHEDKAVADKLGKLLERHGYEVWWDTFLIAGQNYRERIANQLATADKVIVLWSSHSVRSPFVIDEAQRANKLGKLIPVVIDVSDPPMGFGHLHTVSSKDIAAEFGRIVAAIEDRIPISAGEVARTISRQRFLIVGLGAILILVGVGLGGYSIWKREDILSGLDPSLDYRRYHSSLLNLEFVYPQAQLTVDTTQEDKMVIPLLSPLRKVEVMIRRTKLPEHNNVRIGRDMEEKKVRDLGYSVNYLGPREEAKWSNWYIVTGSKPDGSEYFYRRWYTAKDVVSIEFEYPRERLEIYNKIIEDMTTPKRFRFQ